MAQIYDAQTQKQDGVHKGYKAPTFGLTGSLYNASANTLHKFIGAALLILMAIFIVALTQVELHSFSDLYRSPTPIGLNYFVSPQFWVLLSFCGVLCLGILYI